LGFKADERETDIAAGEESRTLKSMIKLSSFKGVAIKIANRKTVNNLPCKKPATPISKLKDFPLRPKCGKPEVLPATPVCNGRVLTEATMPTSSISIIAVRQDGMSKCNHRSAAHKLV